MAIASPAGSSFSGGPHNFEAERALLGGMLVDNRKIPEIIELFPIQARVFFHTADAKEKRRKRKPADLDLPVFAYPANQEIFETIVTLHDKGRAVDLMTLAHELDAAGRYQAVGGAAYLASLEEELVSTLYLHEYARIVVDKWRLRSLLHAAETIRHEAARGDNAVEEVIERAERRIFEISQQTQARDFVHVADVAADDLAEIEARAKHDSQTATGLMTGFFELDRLTTGLRPANLIILAARPSVGKSAFAMNIAMEAAVRQGKPVGIFSLEMSAQELTQRLLCTMANVQLGKVRSNRLSHQDLDRLHAETMRLNTVPLFIDDSSSLTILEMRSRARRLKSRCPNLALIVVDYLQLMRSTGGRVESRQQEVSEISRAIKGLARELEVPIIALSQLSRQVEQRQGRTKKDKMPKLSDLRESGAIEQDADVVIFIHRDFTPKGDQPGPKTDTDLATIRVAKQRNGPVGDFDLLFRGDLTQFVNIHPDAYSTGRG